MLTLVFNTITYYLLLITYYFKAAAKRRLCTSVSKGFQVLFHSPPGVLFTFPSLYCFTIGRQVVFRLGGWSPLIQSGFHVSRPTLDPAVSTQISPTGLSPSAAGFPKTVRLSSLNHVLRSEHRTKSATRF